MINKKKIMFSNFTPFRGGAEIYLSKLINYCSSSNNCIGFSGELTPIRVSRDKFSTIESNIGLSSYSSDILLLNGMESLVNYVKFRIKSLFVKKKNKVVYIHHVSLDDCWGKHVELKKMAFKFCLLFCDKIIRVSPQSLRTSFFIKKTITIPNFINYDEVKAKSKKAKDNCLVNLVMVGRIEENKNQIMAVRLLTLDKRFFLTLVGEVFDDRVKDLAKNLRVLDRVRFVGEVDDVYKYFSLSDVFLNLSKSESFGISIIEAMAYGIPVIATKTAGSSYIIRDGENGFILDDLSVKCLKETVDKVLGNYALCLKIKENAKKTVLEKFDENKILPEIYDFLMQ